MNTIVRSVARLVFGRLLPRRPYRVLRGPLRGARFVLGALAGEAGGVSVYFNAIEPQQTAALVNVLGRGHVFFDVGANVGYYTILASRLVGPGGSVIAIEPALRNLSYLYRHINLNNARNVTVVSAACADALSVSAFAPGTNHATGHLADENDNRNNGVGSGAAVVPVVTIDAVAEQSRVQPDVIKIDVEGAEFLVLKGAHATILEARPTILLSVHSEPLGSACLEYLQGLGYTIETLAPGELLAACSQA